MAQVGGSSTDPNNPVFYQINDNTDICVHGPYAFHGNNPPRGKLCAYIPSRPSSIWACPAPDPVCWAPNRTCSGANSTTAGQGQISCQKDGASWCCFQDLEDCTRTNGQTNVCWAKGFANPLKGASPASANANASAILKGVGIIMQTAPAVGGSGLTTTANGVSSPTGGISTSTGGSSATLTGTVNGVLTTMVMPTSSSPSSILSQSNAGTQSGMRGGAIAGIVVGSIVAVIVLLAAILFGYRRIRRDRRAEMDVGDGKPELPYQNKIYEASSKEATKHSVLQGRGELFEAPDNTMRHELPEGIAGDGRHERNDFSHS